MGSSFGTFPRTTSDALLGWILRVSHSVLSDVHSPASALRALREAALNAALNNPGSTYDVRTVRAIPGYDLYQPIDPKIFADSRAPYGEESPSLDPSSALAAFTRAYSHPRASYNHGSDDMVVSAVVFKDGTATLTDVVQAPRDRRMLDEFESALRQDRSFVPASYDRRPDTMRFYFTLGTQVEVDGQNF